MTAAQATRDRFSRRTTLAVFVGLFGFALLTRFSVFGDTNYFNDEYFYWQAGLRLLGGELPYVDVWDRKGPGLFLTYAVAGLFSSSVLAYQLLALLFAAATAWCVVLIAEHFTTRTGAMLGAALYLMLLTFFGGGGGQSPVFYNLWIALAALALVRSLPALDRGEVPRALTFAMASAGFALTYKQTAVCEGAFFGLFALWRLWRAGVGPGRFAGIAAGLAAAGIAPFALFAACYAATGHWADFWHAMVTANLAKTLNPAGDAGQRIATLGLLIAPALLPALVGALARGRERPLLSGWLLAGIAGFVVVPNFYEHYLLPLCLPIAVAAVRTFGEGRLGRVYGFAVTAFGLLLGPAFDFAARRESREAMAAFAQTIRQSAPAPRLLVFEGPVDLYRQVGTYPPSALYYPLHLYFPAENDVSPIPTATAVNRILAWKPTAIVTYADFPSSEENQASAPQVHGYIARNCRLSAQRRMREVYSAHLANLWICIGQR